MNRFDVDLHSKMKAIETHFCLKASKMSKVTEKAKKFQQRFEYENMTMMRKNTYKHSDYILVSSYMNHEVINYSLIAFLDLLPACLFAGRLFAVCIFWER